MNWIAGGMQSMRNRRARYAAARRHKTKVAGSGQVPVFTSIPYEFELFQDDAESTENGDSGLPSRVMMEAQRLLRKPIPGVSVMVDDMNPLQFHAAIAGPDGTPYEGGLFKLDVLLPENYPHAPPSVRFSTKIYHPNIDSAGRIYLDILKDKWDPHVSVRKVLATVQNLLACPKPHDCLVAEVAETWKRDLPKAMSKAKDWTRFYAIAKRKKERQ